MSCIPINDFSLITLCDATKAGKLYSIVPDTGAGDFDVVRASTATYLGSDGLLKTAANNEPRIEFNPDGSYKGLLVEPAATNLLLRSEEFDDAVWSKIDTTITADDAVAPDGTTTADKLVEGSSTSVHITFQNTAVTAGQSYTASCFAKYDSRVFQMSFSLGLFGANAFANFDVENGVLGTVGSSATASIINFGNGWYKCIITATPTVSGNGGASLNLVQAINSVRNQSYAGDGTSGVFIWGAQLEEGSVATSYIPTVASTVTRAADSIIKTDSTILPTAYPFTLFAEFEAINLVSEIALSFLDRTKNNVYFTIGISQGKYRLVARDLAQATLESISNATTGFHKICGVFTSSELKLFVDGELLGSTTNTIAFNADVTDLLIGQLRTSLDNGRRTSINQAAILPTAISEQQAIQLTS